jgi:hypothetical protein
MANDIKTGINSISNIKVGINQVSKVYKGSDIVWGGTPPTPPIVLFSDQFLGATINTTTNWRLNNPNVTKVEYTQNNKLIITAKDVASTAFGADNLTGLSSWNIATQALFMTFDVIIPQQNKNTWTFGLTNEPFDINSSNRIAFFRSVTTGKVGVAVVRANTSDFASEAFSLDLSTVKRIGILTSPTGLTFYYWSGAQWVSIAITANNFGSTTFKPTFMVSDNTTLVGANQINISRFYLADKFHTTELP